MLVFFWSRKAKNLPAVNHVTGAIEHYEDLRRCSDERLHHQLMRSVQRPSKHVCGELVLSDHYTSISSSSSSSSQVFLIIAVHFKLRGRD